MSLRPLDHCGVLTRLKLVKKHKFKLIKYKTRKITKASSENFVEAFKKEDWEPMKSIVGASEKTEYFHMRLNYLIDSFFSNENIHG